MKQTRWIAVFAAALCVAVAAPAFAQQPDKAEVQERIKALRHKMLVRKVGLSEDKATKVEQIIDGFNGERQKIHKQIAEEKKTLRELLKSNSDDQDSYEGAITRLRAAQKQNQALRDKEFEALKQELTPKEQAKLLRALNKFRNKVVKKLHERNAKGRRKQRDAEDAPSDE